MAVPKRKTTPSRQGMRRAHDQLEALNITFDKNTGEPKLAHNISLTDGYYKGRQVFVPRSQKRAMKAEAAAAEGTTPAEPNNA